MNSKWVMKWIEFKTRNVYFHQPDKVKGIQHRMISKRIFLCFWMKWKKKYVYFHQPAKVSISVCLTSWTIKFPKVYHKKLKWNLAKIVLLKEWNQICFIITETEKNFFSVSRMKVFSCQYERLLRKHKCNSVTAQT